MSVSRKVRLLDPVTLAGGSGTQTSKGIYCQGAQCVAFITHASNAVAPSAITYEFTLDDGLNWNAADASFFDGIQGNVVGLTQVPGRAATVGTRSAAGSAIPGMIATHMRFKVTGNVTGGQDVLNFTVDGLVIFPGSRLDLESRDIGAI